MKGIAAATLLCGAIVLATVALGEGGHGESEVVTIAFESLPPDTILSADTITLSGDGLVTGSLEVASQIDVGPEGVRFSDGSVQRSALVGSPGYRNTIPDFVPPLPYSEICFKQGVVRADVHTVSESTTGGQCLPGDTGWVIEREERHVSHWSDALVTCLADGMRLPEPFEFRYSCRVDAALELSAMRDDTEWSSNRTFAVNLSSVSGITTLSMGNGGCDYGATPWVARSDLNVSPPVAFRCAR